MIIEKTKSFGMIDCNRRSFFFAIVRVFIMMLIVLLEITHTCGKKVFKGIFESHEPTTRSFRMGESTAPVCAS